MIRVVVVDDDFRVANMHAGYVNEVPGFEVVGIAHTAHAAVAVAANSSADLILLDQYLPDAPGTTVIPQVACDVMMLTAAADSAVVREALHLGAVNYLLKPFPQADLAGRLQAYARFRAQLTAKRTLEQSEIDHAIRTLHEGDRVKASLPRGGSSQTAQLVVEAVRAAHHPVTALELAEELGISRGTAQRYLSDLAAQGRLAVTLRYGSSGRPEHLYSWDTSPAARPLGR
jgi:response regulator of citrate/malate metabolism